MKKIIDRIKLWYQSIRLYVIVDPTDNTVTISERLFLHLKENASENDIARVFTFAVAKNNYGFMVNPILEVEEPEYHLYNIQYNDKHKSIGFQTLCPSVGKILYDYNLPPDKSVKLSVSVHRTALNKIYYLFDKPNAKHIRKHTKV